ncbi:MAG: transcription-repair coupling factor [Gemmatimonadota bacterium]|jgi:transcription-repair coupling factor (superfamily II helicase)
MKGPTGPRPAEEIVPEYHHAIVEALASCPTWRTLLRRLPGPGEIHRLGGARGSVGSVALAALHRDLPERVFVAVAADPAGAASVEADLESLLGEGHSRLYPQREALPYESDEPHLEIGGLRVEAVEALFTGRARLLVTTLRALQEKAPVPDALAALRMTLREGEEPGFEALQEALETRGFERTSMVEEVGQFAVRGGILDFFSFGAPEPVRVEFWGDEIVSIRTFDILDQRSTGDLQEVHVLPVDFRVPGGGRGNGGRPGRHAGSGTGSHNRSLLDLLPGEAVLVKLGDDVWEEGVRRTWRHVGEVHDEIVGQGRTVPAPGELFLDPVEALGRLRALPRLDVRTGNEGDTVLPTASPPPVERDMDRLQAILREGAATGRRTLLLCDNEGQAHRLEEILGDGRGRRPGTLPQGAQVAVGSLESGFLLECSDPPLTVLVDHEIFRRSRRVRRGRRFRGAVALESLAQLTPGDYVVHMDHGVGRFTGLEQLEIAGEEMESMTIEYAGGELLRVPVYRLDLVERWVGESDDSEPPRVHRIGGRKWKTLRRRTEAAIEQMTAELLQLYARREVASGHSFPPDTRWQKEMESSFLYEDTPDQRKAAEDVKRDMESARPMDRLVCGDVGYGKTEVAVRAAFKAVQDGKQVAVLAPTTILVEQHRHTFEERLADYPVRIGALSRFRTAQETRDLLEALEAGGLDIVIGTHRLLSKDIAFHDLGLVVVDEEQRFGVRHKEKLKELKASVDVLTLTATPIPRTLYLSLSRVRDLSLIRTPPRDRMPIITHVLPWSDAIVAEAVHRELDRGGQAFFLHNRVETIHTAAEKVRRLVPEARVDVAHGQMAAGKLDRVMTRFVDHEDDVLVCSSIIENGLDVPNANTLIVDRADRFGLSQLYQIRGRVGRSARRAYCYLIVPNNVTEDAEKRLRVLEHYTELGSGYSVALRDLELRGAGNLLGADQSGFAHAVGIDAYLRMLERTVERLRESGDDAERPDPEVTLDGSAYLPDGYISDASQKLHLYRRISKMRAQSEVEELRREMRDRFGTLPAEAERLLEATHLRILGGRLGVERILVRDREARLTFHPGVVPQLRALDRPLEDRQVDVEVRRMAPLSLALKRVGPEPLASTLVRALTALLTSEGEAAA